MYIESHAGAESQKVYGGTAGRVHPEQIAIDTDRAVITVPSAVRRILNVLWRRRSRCLVLCAYCERKCQSSYKSGTAEDAFHKCVLQVEFSSPQIALSVEKGSRRSRAGYSATPELVSRCFGKAAGWQSKGCLRRLIFLKFQGDSLISIVGQCGPRRGELGRSAWFARHV